MGATHNPSNAAVPAWRPSLEDLVRSRMNVPFAWGLHDCCLWAADAVFAQTGVDPAAPWRGTYSSARDAIALVGRLGGMEAIGALVGPAIPPLTAQAGDIGLVRHEGRDSLAVCTGPLWLAPAAAGLAPLPLDLAVAAWRVTRD